MSYQAHYINPLIQFGFAEFDLIIEDDEGVLPPCRIHKTFKDTVTQAELDQEANDSIAWWIAENALPAQPQAVAAEVDLPEGVTIDGN